MAIDMSWCKCGPQGMCCVCKWLTLAVLAIAAVVIGFLISKKKR